MTVAEMLDELYDSIGSTWVTGKSFVEEVGEWVDHLRELEAVKTTNPDHSSSSSSGGITHMPSLSSQT